MAEKTSAVATIEKVDQSKRTLTLKDQSGSEFKVHVPEGVKRFDALKPGDQISVDYYQSVGLSLKKPQAGAQPGEQETGAAAPEAGTLPGGIVARKITETAEVVKVDRAAGKVTIRTPDGELDTIHVTDPSVKKDLDRLQKGDRIQASYTEAVAITVTPKTKNG